MDEFMQQMMVEELLTPKTPSELLEEFSGEDTPEEDTHEMKEDYDLEEKLMYPYASEDKRIWAKSMWRYIEEFS